MPTLVVHSGNAEWNFVYDELARRSETHHILGHGSESDQMSTDTQDDVLATLFHIQLCPILIQVAAACDGRGRRLINSLVAWMRNGGLRDEFVGTVLPHYPDDMAPLIERMGSDWILFNACPIVPKLSKVRDALWSCTAYSLGVRLGQLLSLTGVTLSNDRSARIIQSAWREHRRLRSARTIQHAWRLCFLDPRYALCRKVFMRDMSTIHLPR